MTLFNTDSIAKVIRALIQQEIAKSKALQVFQVTDLNEETYTVNVRHTNLLNIAYNNVPLLGMGMGNFKGMYKLPSVGDFVLLAFFGDTSQNPVVIGTLLDQFTQTPDGMPIIADNEFLLVNSTFGSIIYISSVNDIILKASNGGDLDAGARFRLNHDGSFVLTNKDGYGIKVDTAGNVTISGVTVTFTQTPITFT